MNHFNVGWIMRDHNQIFLKAFDSRFVDDSKLLISSQAKPLCPLSLRWSQTKAKVSQMYKKYGWKFVAGVFTYYLVRDVTLYVILPYMILTQN